MKRHPYRETDPFKIPEVADKMLNEYWDTAESLKIKTFLDYGTCLAFVRDGGYIKGDNDIDVGILAGIEKLEELTAKLVENGFMKRRSARKNWHFLKYNMLLDVHFDFSNPYRKYYQSFDTVIYKGREYNVPHPVEEYLKLRYRDWKIKKHRKVWEG